MQNRSKSSRNRHVTDILVATIVLVCLSLVGASAAVLTGFLPLDTASFDEKVDIGALLLFLPLAALIFAMFSEVIRVSIHGPRYARSRTRPIGMDGWTPGHGEG